MGNSSRKNSILKDRFRSAEASAMILKKKTELEDY